MNAPSSAAGGHDGFSESLSSEDLYGNWYAWVTTNIGKGDNLASIAAHAAAASAARGSGFNAAAKAAGVAWMEAGADIPEIKKGHGWRNVQIGCVVVLVLAIIAVILVARLSPPSPPPNCYIPDFGMVC